MQFSNFSTYLSELEKVTSRLEITQILSGLFKELDESEIYSAIHLSLGQLRPKYDKLEFNLASKMVIRSIALAYQLELSEVIAKTKKLGDLGEVAQIAATNSKSGSQTQQLFTTQLNQISDTSIQSVFSHLEEIAKISGAGSQEKKLLGLASLLHSLDPLSAKYVARMVIGKLRLGFSDMTILDALSWMENGDKTSRNKLELAYQFSPDIGEIGRLVKKVGAKSTIKNVQIKVGVPIIPALAQRLKTATEMIEKMGKVTVDPKYDGTRVQIHFKRQETSDPTSPMLQGAGKEQEVKTFTRNLDESSVMFPELEKLGEFIKATEVILDCEAIGYDPKTGSLLPFQITIQRKRKHGIKEAAKKIPLKFFVFDILYKDGQSLLNIPLNQRIKILEETIIDSQLIEKTHFLVTENADDIRQYHADLLAQGLEGAMVKKFEGIYNPGRKGWSWVKFKETEGSAAKLSDTVDAVVMGLYAGKGKRTVFGVGAFLIGVLNKDEQIVTISKVGTGLSDDQWRELAKKSKEYTVSNIPKNYQVHKDLTPDIWLDPNIVVEVAADEITESPNHSAGLALRFPRLVKFRDDKNLEQITSLEELKQII